MSWIYLITNDVNGKQYIGKTYYENIEKRWKEHLQDYKKERCEKRPLYDAMNKYGIEHFHIQEIEYVSPEINLEKREIYWIAQYDTYYNGYNATLGGDGKHYIDYELIYKFFKEGKNSKEISKLVHCNIDTVTKALEAYNVSDKERRSRGRDKFKKPVYQIDKNTNEILNFFESVADANRFLNKDRSDRSIHYVCQHKNNRKTAYGYKWEYAK